MTKEEHDRQVKAGFIEIEKLENRYDKDKDGDLTFEDANKIASQVKSEFPVFKVLKVVDGGETRDYDYVDSPGNRKKGKKGKDNDNAELSEKIKLQMINAGLPQQGTYKFIPKIIKNKKNEEITDKALTLEEAQTVLTTVKINIMYLKN